MQSLRKRPIQRNAIWAGAESTISPILLAATLPILVSLVGIASYGSWAIVIAVVGLLSTFPLAINDAVTRAVSRARETEGRTVRETVSCSLMLSLSASGVPAVLLGAAALFLAGSAVELPLVRRSEIVMLLGFAAPALPFRGLESTCLAILRGFERYDIAAKVGLSARVLYCGAVIVGAQLAGIGGLAVAVFFSSLVTAVGFWLAASSVTGSLIVPTWNKELSAPIVRLATLTWIQLGGGAMFAHVDRLVVGAILGTVAAGRYALAVGFAQPILQVTSAAFHVLLPVASRAAVAAGSLSERVYGRAVRANLLVAGGLAASVGILGYYGSQAYGVTELGSEFPYLMLILSASYGLLASAVTPHNVLLAYGRNGFLASINLTAGLLTIGMIALLCSFRGLIGAGLGNLTYGSIIAFNYLKVARLSKRMLHG